MKKTHTTFQISWNKGLLFLLDKSCKFCLINTESTKVKQYKGRKKELSQSLKYILQVFEK